MEYARQAVITRDIEVRNIFLLGLAAVWGAVQLVIVAGLLAGRVPIADHLTPVLLPEALKLLKPEREILLYRFFVAAALGLQAGGLWVFRRRLGDLGFYQRLKEVVWTEGLLTAGVSLTLVRMAVLGKGLPATAVFYALLCGCFLAKIFWWQRRRLAPGVVAVGQRVQSGPAFTLGLDILLPAFILAFFFIPDPQGVTARIFVEDTWFHIDNFIMSAGWAVSKGQIPYVDINGQYGVGMPIMINLIAQALGGFDYPRALSAMVGVVSVYFILCYVFLRLWLKNALLASFGVLMAIKLQMLFLPAEFSCIWKYPSHTVVRFFCDSVFFIFLWRHLETGRQRDLSAALICAGAAFVYVLDSGIYLLFSAYVYLTLRYGIPALRPAGLPRRRAVFRAGFNLVLPLATLLILMGVAVGGRVWAGSFWTRLFSFHALSLGGLGAVPLSAPLAEGSFTLFFQGCALPLLYVFTIIVNLGLIIRGRRGREHLLPVILAVYGLAILHYWIFASVALKSPPVCIPAVLIGCYWIREFIQRQGEGIRAVVPGLLTVFAVLAFWATPAAQGYPNIFNAGRISYDADKKALATEFAIDDDVALIRRWTAPEDRVPLISVFESYLFIAADRQPFFYDLPLLNPRHFEGLDFGGTRLLMKQQVQDLLDQLEARQPPVVFIERRLISGQLPSIYYRHYSALNGITSYLKGHYVPLQQGKHLLALKRVGGVPAR